MTQNNHTDASEMVLSGFWVYLMTDCMLFVTLFATYLVLYNNTYGGPSAHQLFSPSFALTETLILLASSFASGLSLLTTDKKKIIAWLGITFLLGVAFLWMEVSEFRHLVQAGNSWQRSAFLSAFFTLVGTHGLHITTGLLWMIVLIIPVAKHGLTPLSLRRLTCLKLFWHFLDIVWIFIFTIVYLMGIA